jgi:predicted nicotinamide N-methyase
MSIRYRTERHRFGTIDVQIKRVENLDTLIEQITDEEFSKDERLPYWAELWPSAIGLARFLVSVPDLIEGKSVLELGVGLGLTSLVLHYLRPRTLLLTDYEEAALNMTRENFALNHLSVPQTRLLDWRFPDLAQRFDCIVASDILYEERFFLPLIRLFERYLNRHGTIIIAEPGRAVARLFFELLKERGFRWQSVSISVPENPKPIEVTNYLITRV